MRDVFDRANKRDLSALASELIAPEFVRHDLADLWIGVEGQGGVQDFLAMLTVAAPHLHLEIHDVIEDGLGLHRELGRL